MQDRRDCRSWPSGCRTRFDTRVRVELGQRKGRIVVEFGYADDLERIAALMGGALG